ncbi:MULTISPECIES: hypothetical protein [unclassified Mycobacteroides]|uniref:VG15 protein n=1 Tax=unclassified Mycobacteroides TaxID=2618759 RepID=UPI0007136E55|nr:MULTISPECIES: hypothetical protein [unclassified Mycobacteroides]KRQ27163.1 hypothetical protein AOT87_04265 [Mycobacteroides sp. H003]KRQ32527.1 hypothetical protein AOT91_11595 [Mycobacteroides sp. H092]KRQ42127.1 hypothetical protein AOT88_25510 [Mycobacteroides sp. H063]KRQ43638.1 hypothetical protein AOT92_07740 [Mycobacteroides sp. H101]KRQ54363.1 hypothetical protein AOT94_22775 [Mycobacteroides sp. HXVII]
MDHADYAAAVAELRRRLLAYAATVWSQVELDDAGLERLIELMAPTVLAAQLQVGNLTSVYFAEVAGVQAIPAGGAITTARGVAPEVVYARPVITARTALARGKPVQQALAAGGRRLQNIAGTDLQMAKVRQSQRSLEHSGRQYFRRVPTGAENCAMCLIAATQRYKTKRLMPIHPGCDCNIAPLSPRESVSQVIDQNMLEATHTQVKAFTDLQDRGGRAPDYRKLLVTHEHGEVGPVIGWAGQQFTSKSDL